MLSKRPTDHLSIPENLPQAAAQPANSAAAANGLTSQEAEARLKQFGPNDPAPPQRHSAVLDFLRLFLNPLVLILLIAALLSAFLGDATDAAIIVVIVLLSTALDFTQTYKSRRAIEQLRQQVGAHRHRAARREVAGNPAKRCGPR